MTFQELKAYTLLNLQRTGLVLSKEDQKATEALSPDLRSIHTADFIYQDFHHEVRENRISRFCYSNMSLTYWALVVCMSMLGMLLSEYVESGEIMMASDYAWMLYILPAIFLVGRFFLFSFINIGHFILLALCVVLTIFKIRIFGSELNWMWVFMVVGTLITLAGRIWEGTHRMKEHKQWYQKNAQTLTDAEKAIAKITPVYQSVGAAAAAEMRQHFPDVKSPGRTPWFAFSRRLDHNHKVHFPPLPDLNTDFIHQKQNRTEVISTGTETGKRYVTIHGQKMGYADIDSATAQKYIRAKQLVPFYGMGLPEHMEGLKYTIYLHRWSESIHEVGEYSSTRYSYRQTNARTNAKREYEQLEYDHLGTSAENFQIHTQSTAAWVRTQEYLDEKKRKLDQLSDVEVTSRTVTGTFDRTNEKNYEQIAAMYVTSPDGLMVGLYCGESRQAITFASNLASKYWNARLSAWAMPSSEIQQGFLHQEHLN